MAGNTIHVQGSYIDVHDNENVYLSVDRAEVRMRQAAQVGQKEKRRQEEQQEQRPETCCAAPAESFVERVKTIMRKAATKNGEIMTSKARGHEREYTFYVNADAFCKAMDDMMAGYSDKLKEMLGGTLETVQVSKVCLFIGQVIRMHVINDEKLQAVDLLFAFEDYYDNLQTVQAKLGQKNTTDDQEVVFGTFRGLLKKYIS